MAITIAITAGVLLAAMALLIGPDQSAASPSSSTLIDLRALASLARSWWLTAASM